MIKMTMLGRDSGRHSHSLSFKLHLHWRHIITITIIIFLGRRHRRYCVGARTPHRGDITIMIIVLIAHRHHGQIKGFLASHGHRATSASEVYALLRLLLPHLRRGSFLCSSSPSLSPSPAHGTGTGTGSSITRRSRRGGDDGAGAAAADAWRASRWAMVWDGQDVVTKTLHRC